MISETNELIKIAWTGRNDLAILLFICAIFLVLSAVISLYLYNLRKSKIEMAIDLIKQGHNKKVVEMKKKKRLAQKKKEKKQRERMQNSVEENVEG